MAALGRKLCGSDRRFEFAGAPLGRGGAPVIRKMTLPVTGETVTGHASKGPNREFRESP
jgi:hypothetical protein